MAIRRGVLQRFVTAWFLMIGSAALLATVTARAADVPPPSLLTREWTIDGAPRTALLYVPTGAQSSPAPLVFVFHGHGGTARGVSNSFATHRHWPEAIVAYMQGLPTPGKLTDPEGKRNGWQAAAGVQGDRDLKFFDEVLASLRKQYKVDDNRIYSTGHSNGGGFTYLLWAERGDVFAAVAPSAALTLDYAKLKPKPALHLAGETDPLVKYEWQKRMIDEVRKINGCGAEGKPWATAGPVVGTEFPSTGGTPLVTLIHPAGHTFPREAPELIVRFFKEHAKQ